MKIGIDLDGVLTDSWHENVYTECQMYNYIKEGVSFEEFWTVVYKEFNPTARKFFADNAPLYFRKLIKKENILFLKDLSKDHEIFYITSRPKSVMTDTEIWFNKQDLPYKDNLYFSTRTKSKGFYCKELGIDLMVEDITSVAEEIVAVSSNTTVVLISHPWNKDQNEFKFTSDLYKIGELDVF